MRIPWPPYDLLQALPGMPSRPALFVCRACGARDVVVNRVRHESTCGVDEFERRHGYDGNSIEVQE